MMEEDWREPLCSNVTLKLQDKHSNKGDQNIGMEAVREFIMDRWMKYQTLTGKVNKSRARHQDRGARSHRNR